MPTLAPAAPEMFLAAAICAVLLVDVFLSDSRRGITYVLAMVAIVGTAAFSAWFAVDERLVTFHGSFVADPAGHVLKMFAYATVAVAFLYSRDYLIRNRLFKGEYFVLGLFGLLGIMVMISAHSLLTMYLGLELLSLSLYALVAFNRDAPVSSESAMKYFVLGAIATGTMLYGISLLYGVTGTIEFAALAAHFAESEEANIPALLAIAFIIVGVAFKFGAVPFHMWLPDVYQGAPSPVALYVGSAPKIAAFALTWRVLSEAMGPLQSDWQGMLLVLCVLSLAVGNVVAIAQTNLKRMLAYSTISHVGFILLGFIAGTEEGIQAAMFYTFAYVIMAAGAFGMIILLSRQGFEAEKLEDFKGLNGRSSWYALIMLMIMFSMAGVPPFIGFHATLLVFASVIEVGLVWLAVVGVLFAVIGAYYYLRLVWYMYFAETAEEKPLLAARDMRVVLSINGVAVLALGVFPGFLLDLCARVLG